LQGTGMTGAITVHGGTLQPGDGSAGILTSNQGVTLDSSSKFVVMLGGSNPGVNGYSQLRGNGVIDLGSSTPSLFTSSSFPVTLGQQFTIIDPPQGILNAFAQAQFNGVQAQFNGNAIIGPPPAPGAAPVQIGVDVTPREVILIANYTDNVRFVDELFQDLL